MILWLDPFSGVSGDMLLGVLLDLGAPADGVRAAVADTGLRGWRLEQRTVRRGGLVATRAEVVVDDQVRARRAGELLELVGRARPASVAATAARAVGALAEVEAGLHGMPVADVHLHEIGGIDTVVDTVGVAAALELLGVTAVHCGPVALGSGTVPTAHGELPLPAPATAALLARMGAPVRPTGGPGETVTPTGAALLLATAARFGPVPAMTVQRAGRGAGGRDDPQRPNVLPALLGSASATVEELVELVTNLDDVTGELLGHLVALALAAGARDAWVVPIVMKKGRPAHSVHVLVEPARAAECERLLLRETGSLGVRRFRTERVALPRTELTVEVAGHAVRIKVGPWGSKPEHDDVAAAAAALGLPLREVQARALALGNERRVGPTRVDESAVRRGEEGAGEG